MAENSKIGWTGGTWNPWIGCTKVSAGCDNCYMFRGQTWLGKDPSVLRATKTMHDPERWREPKLIFTCSLSDWFHEDADAWRPEAWGVIKNTQRHRYQILTKRPQRILECLPADKWLANVWLGVSVENTKALARIRYFERLEAAGYAFPARFVSFEPLIERIDIDKLAQEFNKSPYEWAIIGGESGFDTGDYKYRPAEWEWMQELVQFHQERQVPVFFKQTGRHLALALGIATKDHKAGENIEALQALGHPYDRHTPPAVPDGLLQLATITSVISFTPTNIHEHVNQ